MFVERSQKKKKKKKKISISIGCKVIWEMGKELVALQNAGFYSVLLGIVVTLKTILKS